MLTITPQALAVMRQLTDHPAMEPTAGLRIAQRDDASAPMEVSAVQGPQTGDSVLERGGALLYLSPDAAQRVEGHGLDAMTDSRGRVQFILKAAR